MARNIVVGIDIGSSTTRVVVTEYRQRGAPPRILGTGTSESRGLRQGYITQLDDTVKSIKKAVAEAEKNSRVKITQAFLSIGGVTLGSEIAHGSAVISRADKEVTELDVNKAINESEENLQIINKKIIHVIPVLFKLDGKEVLGDPQGMQGIKLEVKTLFVTSLEQHLDNLITAVRRIGVEVVDVIASPLAASMVALSEKQKSVGCILVDIGAETVAIAVFENGTVTSLHVFSIGSTDITNDVALGLKIPIEEAEELKLGRITSDYPKKKLDEIIEARLSDIFELIENHLKKINRNGLLPAGVIIIGGGSNVDLIEDLSKKILKLPSKIGRAKLFANAKHKVRDSSWFVALGLCIAGRRFYSQSYSGGTPLWQSIKRFFSSIGRQLLP